MTLLLASTFNDALGRLSHNEQKQAKLTAFDLQMDPTGNGLQMHRIESTPGFWSARVSRDLRIILHKEGATTTLAWVDHHDAAYAWAERRRIVPHERTGAMQIVQPAPAGTDPFTHPDAQRRFRVLDNLEELQAALAAPFAQWAVFLHPVQRALVERPVTGPTRVTGSAGTGKTIVALHRAVRLAREDAQARVLLTTFSKPLAEALERKRDLLTQADAGLRERVVVRPLDQAAVELYTRLDGQPNRATSSQLRALIAAAQKAGLGGALTPAFLWEEWEELVDAWGVTDPDAYATIPRTGRRTRLGSAQREAAWGVFAYVARHLEQRRLVTWAMIYRALTRWLGAAASCHTAMWWWTRRRISPWRRSAFWGRQRRRGPIGCFWRETSDNASSASRSAGPSWGSMCVGAVIP